LKGAGELSEEDFSLPEDEFELNLFCNYTGVSEVTDSTQMFPL